MISHGIAYQSSLLFKILVVMQIKLKIKNMTFYTHHDYACCLKKNQKSKDDIMIWI